MCQAGNVRFAVDDLAKAEWTLKKIVERQKEIAEKSEQAKRMKADYVDEVDKWLQGEVETLNGEIAFFEGQLEPFIIGELEKSGGRKKSVSLPSGKCGYRKGRTLIRFGGEEANGKSEKLTEWAKENCSDCVKVTEAVDWAMLKKRLDVLDDGRVMIDGEVLDGFSAEVEEARFYVKGAE